MEAKEEGEKERNERYQKNMKTRSEKISLKKYNNSETHSIMSLLVKGFFFSSLYLATGMSLQNFKYDLYLWHL